MVAMPALDETVLARRAEIVAALRAIVPGEGVIDSEVGMRPYESDGLTAYRQLPSGIEEGLLLEDGEILEGLSSNFFALFDGSLRTEEERVLLGVTRSLVLEVAETLVPVERRALRASELARASEAFLTSVSREVLPVVRVDGAPIGDGRVGPTTRRIIESFAALASRTAERL